MALCGKRGLGSPVIVITALLLGLTGAARCSSTSCEAECPSGTQAEGCVCVATDAGAEKDARDDQVRR
jgi:hypothetical protein